MDEQTKSHNARFRNRDYLLLTGKVLDIGCGKDPIKLPAPAVVQGWDQPDGDAQYLESLKDNSFDTVVSSHCLEHMVDVPTSLKNWARVLKPNGHMLIYVPSWTFYERRRWPSRYNPDHKASFDLLDPENRPDTHPFYGFKDMRGLGLKYSLELIDARLELDGYDLAQTWNLSLDQTFGKAQAQVAFLFRKIA
jgi:SAM-dependent methyltransferase